MDRDRLPSWPAQPPPPVALPPGTPSWITPELLQQTLDSWQPHFPKALTTADALEILNNVGRLFALLEK